MTRLRVLPIALLAVLAMSSVAVATHHGTSCQSGCTSHTPESVRGGPLKPLS